MCKVSDMRVRWKGKQVWILHELVTVFCKQGNDPLGNREGDRCAGVKSWSNEPGDLPFAVQERKSSGHEELAVRNGSQNCMWYNTTTSFFFISFTSWFSDCQCTRYKKTRPPSAPSEYIAKKSLRQKTKTTKIKLYYTTYSSVIHFVLPIPRGLNFFVPVLRKAGLPAYCSDTSAPFPVLPVDL